MTPSFFYFGILFLIACESVSNRELVADRAYVAGYLGSLTLAREGWVGRVLDLFSRSPELGIW